MKFEVRRVDDPEQKETCEADELFDVCEFLSEGKKFPLVIEVKKRKERKRRGH